MQKSQFKRFIHWGVGHCATITAPARHFCLVNWLGEIIFGVEVCMGREGQFNYDISLLASSTPKMLQTVPSREILGILSRYWNPCIIQRSHCRYGLKTTIFCFNILWWLWRWQWYRGGRTRRDQHRTLAMICALYSYFFRRYSVYYVMYKYKKGTGLKHKACPRTDIYCDRSTKITT